MKEESSSNVQLGFDQFESKVNSSTHDSTETEPIDNTSQSKSAKLIIPRYFSNPEIHPYDELEWEFRDAEIKNDKGKVIFQQENIQVPVTWSQTALNIVASKYFHLRKKTGKKENNVKQLIDRVAKTLTTWGTKDNYFETATDAKVFEEELTHLLVNQKAAFNSPVWFNMGCDDKPQCSACFINAVEDDMESILTLAKIEGMLFKYGSGTGTNFSSLRSSFEATTRGGKASGPVSFMRGYDSFAGIIKSGGKTRRAAKMVIMDIDHPDIKEFIDSKVHEEQKAWKLIDAGYSGDFGGEAYSSVFFQNANNSVRVSDEFMDAVVEDREWCTRAVTNGEIIERHRAKDLMDKITKAAHVCGDPGIQFDSTINGWHTCSNSAKINASNPCSEYMFVDNSACNLASLNLMKFVDGDEFNIEAFRRAVHILIIAQEIIVDNSSYPTEKITQNSHKFRPLGLGYANLGALLMYFGMPYDSLHGHAMAATITALLTGQAYLSSATLASAVGSFEAFDENKQPMLQVMKQHRNALDNVDKTTISKELYNAACDAWDDAIDLGNNYGYRNAQTTVLAPTGTIGFMMDCDTTGIEPDLALVKFKSLVGGGFIKLVNTTIQPALQRLGYTDKEIVEILDHIEINDTIEGAPYLKEEDLAVFDCAFKPQNGKRFIHHMGHIRMMAAVQPFLSGAISKTVNMPSEATPKDIEDTYIEAWKLGLKAVAIYRDGSKRTQPMSTSKKEVSDQKADDHTHPQGTRGIRRHLPDERNATTHKFSIAGHEGYLTVGEYEDGTPGEVFITMAKEGSVVSGLMDCFATSISIGLQSGVPLETYVKKFAHTLFEPYGFTNNPEIRMAKSIPDYIFRWLELRYLGNSNKSKEAGSTDLTAIEQENIEKQKKAIIGKTLLNSTFEGQEDAPPCPDCGNIMVRNGACYKCTNCGGTSGCS